LLTNLLVKVNKKMTLLRMLRCLLICKKFFKTLVMSCILNQRLEIIAEIKKREHDIHMTQITR
jgi:hypothetical protein